MAARMRTVCLIHSHLGPALTRMGLRVYALSPPAGLASLPELLTDLPEPPDCVIHQEDLGRRLVLLDQERVPCPTIFWSQDTHLNTFWQRHYARTVSATSTTQPHLTTALRGDSGAPAAWVPWHGHARPLAPTAGRPVALAFVGRVTDQRRRRQWFLEHLRRFDLVHRQDVFGPELATVYESARLAPNECIAGEINLRLFEAASCGCLPVSERRPEAVAELFVPEREALYYDDVLELDDLIRFALAHPSLTEKMARAAHAAVAERHLADHRARSLLDLAQTAGQPPRGPATDAATALTLYQLDRAGQLRLPRDMLWQRLAAAPATPAIMAARIQTALAGGDTERAAALAAACLARPELATDPRSAAACALAACRLGDAETAKRAYVAVLGATGRKQAPRLHDLRDYLLFFAGALEEAGEVAAPGAVFDPERQLPENAAQCLIAAKALHPGDLEIDRRLEALLGRLPGAQAEQVGLLSGLTLHRPDDWSLGLRLALADLQAFRLEAGIEETRLAAATAARLGQQQRFARRLALADPTGRLRRLAFP